MRTELFKVINWQVKLVVKKTNNSTNNLPYYIYLILSYSTELIEKTATKVSSLYIREEIPCIPYLSHKDKTRKHGEYFPGHHSQARSITAKNFGAPLTHGNKRQESNKNTARTAWLKEQINPATIEYNIKKISVDQAIQIAWKWPQVLPDHFENPSENIGVIQKSKGPSRTERSFRETVQIVHGQ